MTKQEKMTELRTNPGLKCNCAQAVAIPFAEEMGLTEEQAGALTRQFGSGMGCGSVCGAVTGALMVMGGLDLPSEKRAELLERFRRKNGAVDCASLLRAAAERGEPRKEHCDRMIAQCLDYLCEITDQK